MFYSHESEEINTLQTKSSDNSMRFIHKVPTNFHISHVLLRSVCDDFESCKVQGETPLKTITCSKHHIVLFFSMSFSSQVSHRRFLTRQYQYKFICHISYFPHRSFCKGYQIKTTYVISSVFPHGGF